MSSSGRIFNIEKYHLHDGSGIRTAVFFKGCNLVCPWCSNPESQSTQRQMVIHRNLCTGCLQCYRVCPRSAVYYIGSHVMTNMDLCDFCGKCVEMCPNSARQIYGRDISVEELMKELRKDAVYYARSGGGVTFTGGEPLLQPAFLHEVAWECRNEFFDTAIETAGFVPWQNAWLGVEHIDTILLDVKSTQPENLPFFLQKGANAEKMLKMLSENIEKMKEKGKNIIFRCPIIPGFNDNRAHMQGVIEWAKRFQIQEIDLLPFHQYGKHKYDSLGMQYQYATTPAMTDAQVDYMKDMVEDAGLICVVGG